MTNEDNTTYRLNKFIAHAGICSRRKAADLVKAGKVKVNGKIEDNPAIEVTDSDVIEYDGQVLKPVKKMIYLLLNKPKAVVTSMNDEQGRKTVWDIVQSKVKSRVFPVGRLDMYTTGLLLLTNDGDLALKLSHPRNNIKKIYRVKLSRELEQKDLDAIAAGIELEDGIALIDGISYVTGAPKDEVGIEIHIGKNRIIRRIFEHLEYSVVTLDRVYYAGLTKKDLPRGWSRFLDKREIIMLKHFQGTKPKD